MWHAFVTFWLLEPNPEFFWTQKALWKQLNITECNNSEMGWKIKQRKRWKNEGKRAEKREGQKIKKNEAGKKKVQLEMWLSSIDQKKWIFTVINYSKSH